MLKGCPNLSAKASYCECLEKYPLHHLSRRNGGDYGTSGSGKSTLLNMISAIDEPTDGALFLFGKEAQAIYQEPKASQFRKENIGFIFQSFHLLKDLTVEDNIALPLF